MNHHRLLRESLALERPYRRRRAGLTKSIRIDFRICQILHSRPLDPGTISVRAPLRQGVCWLDRLEGSTMPAKTRPRAFRSGLFVVSAFAALTLSGAARAQSAGTGREGGRHAVAPKPQVDLTSPADSTDFTQDVSADLNAYYDQYNAFKNTIQNDLNIQFSMPVSVIGQWGSPNGGSGVAEMVYSPTLTWTPFTNTAIGSGAFTFSFQQNQFWTPANTNSQQGSMGLLAAPNDWGSNGYQIAQITYTQTFPGNWLAVSVGQYSFGQYDGQPIRRQRTDQFPQLRARSERHADLRQCRRRRLCADHAKQSATVCRRPAGRNRRHRRNGDRSGFPQRRDRLLLVGPVVADLSGRRHV